VGRRPHNKVGTRGNALAQSFVKEDADQEREPKWEKRLLLKQKREAKLKCGNHLRL